MRRLGAGPPGPALAAAASMLLRPGLCRGGGRKRRLRAGLAVVAVLSGVAVAAVDAEGDGEGALRFWIWTLRGREDVVVCILMLGKV